MPKQLLMIKKNYSSTVLASSNKNLAQTLIIFLRLINEGVKKPIWSFYTKNNMADKREKYFKWEDHKFVKNCFCILSIVL